MNAMTQQLNSFLSSCRGNWRNALFIRDSEQSGGYLMTADRDGTPVLMEMGMFCRLTGQSIDPEECRSIMAQNVFEDIYAQYLLWRLPSAQEHSLRALCSPDYEKGWAAQ